MNRYPWRNTSEDIAEQTPSQWETPAGAQAKADAAEAAAKEYSDERLAEHVGTGGDAHALAVPDGEAGFISGADQAKLNGIEEHAEVNQNAFAQVNNVVAASESDTLTIAGGTGIAISTNPTTKTVTVTATGEATPGPHGSSHNNDGSDPIPELVALRDEFDALTPESIGAETPEGAQAKVDALAGAGNTKTVAEVAEDVVEVAAQLADVMSQTINVKSPPPPLVAAVGDGTMDDTAALGAIFDYCRQNKIPVFLPSSTYKISASLDVSGLEIFGVMGGYNNQSGTIIEGSGDHAILVQESVTADKITYSIKNLGLRNGTLGLKMTYAVHCVIENVSVIDCLNGIELGDPNILGTLWNNFRNCRVDVTGIALKVNGRDYSNANIFETCYFKGGEGAATVDSGGIGAVANQFINTEFAGPELGLVLKRTRSISLTNCYFESEGPSIVLDGSNWDTYVEKCSFSVLKNNNPSGANTFIWHKSGVARVTVVSGYVYIVAGGMYDNLSFIQSDATSSFILTMMDPPEREVYASGFRLFSDGLPTNNSTIVHQSTYTPQWTTNGTQPDIGNGTLTGRYTLSGRLCTVQVELSAGTTTTFGTGQFQISLPFPANAGGHRAQGIARIFDSGTGHFIALAEVNAGSSICVFYTNNSPNLVQHNSPMTWGANDALRFTITYEI